MDYCLISQSFSIFIFVVFLISFIMLSYFLANDHEHSNRPQDQTMWMYAFVFIVGICVLFSGWCIYEAVQKHSPLTNNAGGHYFDWKFSNTAAKKQRKRKREDPFYDKNFFGSSMQSSDGFVFG